MSRDGNGNYTLPLGAVATGEVIASTWANTSLDDIAAAMTDSLARSGNGGMLAPFRATDGTINAPSLSFNNETNSGVYRSSAGDYRLCVNGKDKARIRDVNGMAAFQVFDLAGTGAWETLAKAADVAALSLANVLAVGNTTGGTDLSVSAADDLLLTDTSKIIASNGLAGSLERKFQLYVDGAANGIVKFQSKGNTLAISSDTSITLGSFGDWPMVKVTQVDARLSYGVGVGVNLVKLQTTATGINVTGTVTADGVTLGNNEKITLGGESDGKLEIYEATGGNGVIEQTGSGSLVLKGQNTDITNDANDLMIRVGLNEAALYHRNGDNAGKKLQTTNTGIDVTGTVEADAFIGDSISSAGAGTEVVFNDSIKLANSATKILGNDDIRLRPAAAKETNLETSAGAVRVQVTDTVVQLYYGADLNQTSVKLTTTNTGIDVTGGFTADYIDLTGGEATTTTGTIACKMIVLDDLSTTQNDASTIFTEATGTTSSLVISQADDTADTIKLRVGSAGTLVDALTASTDGIDVTGTVEADGFSGTGTVAITDFVTDVSTNDNDTTVPTTAAVKTYVDTAGGNETLAETLALGNTTGGTDIELTTGDILTSEAGANVNVQAAVGYGVRLTSSGGISRFYATETQAQLFYGATAAAGTKVLETTATGIDVTGDLDVTGTVTSSKTTVNNAADILYTAFNSFAGKRIINTASATATTYGLPTPVAADIGKSWVICNPTDSLITIDHDASGTANYVWIMDGVTLSAAASSWSIKKGAIVEIVVAAATVGGGSATAPNYLIFGAGLLEL